MLFQIPPKSAGEIECYWPAAMVEPLPESHNDLTIGEIETLRLSLVAKDRRNSKGKKRVKNAPPDKYVNKKK